MQAELDRRLHALITLAGARDPRVVGWDGWTATRLRRKVHHLLLAIEGELEPEAVVPGIERTADQRRADLFALLPALALHALDGTSPVSGAAGGCTHPAVVLHVHVPLATTLGLSERPGLLDGHGPISACHVRSLLPSAALRLVLVDEVTGKPRYLDPDLHQPRSDPSPPAGTGAPLRRPAPGARTRPAPRPHLDTPAAGPSAASGPGPALTPGSSAGPTAGISAVDLARIRALVPDRPVLVVDEPEPQHDPSAGLARFVQLRDPLCTGPDCAMASTRSDLDHLDPWPHGPTSAANLGPKSRRCHRAKTLTRSATRHPDGSHTWRSPTGPHYRVPPARPLPPALRRPHRRRPVDGESEEHVHRDYPDPHLRLPGDGSLTDDLDSSLTGCAVGPPRVPEPSLRSALDDVPPPF